MRWKLNPVVSAVECEFRHCLHSIRCKSVSGQKEIFPLLTFTESADVLGSYWGTLRTAIVIVPQSPPSPIANTQHAHGLD